MARKKRSQQHGAYQAQQKRIQTKHAATFFPVIGRASYTPPRMVRKGSQTKIAIAQAACLRHLYPQMKTQTLLCSASLALVSVAFLRPALAAPPASCALISHGGVHATDQSVTLDTTTLRTPDGSASLSIKQMQYTASTASSAAALQDQADAASLLLLSAMTGHHNAACSVWLQQQGQSVANGLKNGGTYTLAWNTAAIQRGTAHVGLTKATLKLEGNTSAHTSAATLAMAGLSFRNVANQELLPSSAQAAFSLPASELPALMAAVGGKAEQAPAVHVTISNFAAQHGTVSLQGNGSATLTGDVNATSAAGHLEITNLETLIETARNAKQMKLAAGLVLARLVSNKQNDANTWNTTWSGGVLTVNGFPLPIK